MPVLTIVYARSHTLAGLLIRHADRWGRWSHCAIATGAGTVVEARMWHGVVETPWDEFERRYPGAGQRACVEVHCAQPDAGIAWARAQIGARYDHLAVLGQAVRESWQRPNRWHCAELAEAALVRAGRRRFRDAPHHISPNLSYMVT